MKKIGIVILCTNAYFVLGIRFVKRFMHFYKGNEKIIFYLFTDTDPKDYLPEGIKYEYIHTTNKSWTEGTNSKFISILSLENRDIDYLYFFDADTSVDREFTEEWFLAESTAGQHYADQIKGWMLEKKGFERNPRSKAYVPLDTPLFQVYTYGAFWGGSKEWVLKFCKTMLEWQLADRSWGFEAGTQDESYSNAYFHYNPPAKLVPCTEFKFVISHKGGLKDTRNINLDTSEIRSDLLKYRNENIDIANGKVIVSGSL